MDWFLYLCKTMRKLKAILLVIIFLLGGSGLSVDIAQCCDQFSGIGLSFKSHKHEADKDCCACLKMASKKACCDDVVIQTVINPVLGLSKIVKLDTRQFISKIFYLSELRPVLVPVLLDDASVASLQDEALFDPVPLLIKKRVLQI
jgi:hypothetical protein